MLSGDERYLLDSPFLAMPAGYGYLRYAAGPAPMTPEQLTRVESELGRSLPNELRELYLEYPFAAGSYAGDLAMPPGPDDLIKANATDGFAASIGLDSPKILLIGSDGGELVFFADWRESIVVILEYDMETGETRESHASLSEWIDELNGTQALLDAAAEYVRDHPWWKFWTR